QLARLENFQQHPAVWGVLQNRNNINGRPPRAKNSYTDNDFNETIDRYGIEDAQSAPLYTPGDLFISERYGRDGTPVKLIQKEEKYTYAEVMGMEGHWQIPSGYIKTLPGGNSYPFKKVIFVDRTHQHVTALEKAGNKWLVRSMNPATTGIHRPPYRRKTPLGIFVLQEKKPRMFYLKDGSDQLEGFALYANRFTAGGYLHGVAVEFPQTEAVEFCSSLGSVPESHMCVRNATSHARFIYDWAPAGQSLICVIE
ncbi:MAG: L,D-transpeptidase, partial [Tannerellaceae bacterium]|nr:L,D-transpeptidase [Tannerellaceae bacterium]